MDVNIPLAQYPLKRLIHTTLFSPMARASAWSGPAKAYLHEQAASTEAHSSPEALQTTAKAVQLGLVAALVVVGLACMHGLSMQHGDKELRCHIPILVILHICAEWRIGELCDVCW